MKHSFSFRYKNVFVRQIEHKDLESMRCWRNDHNNTQFLRQIPIITSEAQKDWYRRYINNENEIGFAVEETDILNSIVGSAFLYNIGDNQAEFGRLLIGDSNAHGHRIGIHSTIAILNIAFKKYHFERIILHCYVENIVALRVYKSVGFEIVEQELFDNKKEYTMCITREKFYSLYIDLIDENGGKSMRILEKVELLEFPQNGDERGHLVVIEGEKNIPFAIKRAFYIYGSVGDVVRGKHANRKSEFVLINVAGTSKVRLDDGRGNEKIFDLDRPHMGIYIPKMIWKDMYNFSSDSVLLCLSSEHYDAEEYIRDYDDYCKIMKEEMGE